MNWVELFKNFKSKIKPNDFCHYDPRLNQKIGIFGQANAAQSELDNLEVQTGDLFLFFGWFRNVGKKGTDLHHLFGWLQIDEIIKGEKDIKNYLKLKKLDHPHGFEDVSRYKNNTLYLGANKLTLNKRKLLKRARFKKTHRDLILTEENKQDPIGNFRMSSKTQNLFMNRLKWSDSKSKTIV